MPKRVGYKQAPEHIQRRMEKFRETIRNRPDLYTSEKMSERARTHGMRGTRTYQSWISMRQRCQNKNLPAYARYGGRGIKVCDRWQSFENFYADMGGRPEGCSLDRIDNDGDYEPGNCRWASSRTQSRNWRDANHRIAHDGQYLTVAEWSEKSGIEYHTLHYRLIHGWSIEAALTTPVRGSTSEE